MWRRIRDSRPVVWTSIRSQSGGYPQAVAAWRLLLRRDVARELDLDAAAVGVR